MSKILQLDNSSVNVDTIEMGGVFYDKRVPPRQPDRVEFEAVTRPLIRWLNENCNPHAVVFIDPTSAVLYEGQLAYVTRDYLPD